MWYQSLTGFLLNYADMFGNVWYAEIWLLAKNIGDICPIQEGMFDKHSVWTVNGRCLAQSGHLRPLVYTKCWHTGTQWGH